MNAYILLLAFVLDLCFGDPPRLQHIVVGIGKIIALCERALRPLFRDERFAGTILVAVVLLLSAGLPSLVLRIHPLLECFVCFQLLATKSLGDAANRVYAALARNDLPAARTAVGMIVGRDTAGLDAAGVTRATVETVAENASDGVVAPMFFFALGGAPLMLAYKAINTMDSMIGYKNEKYLHFGRAAARLDDIANFVPARLTACLMLLTAGFPRNAFRIYRRDRRAHGSPNAGHPEAACAGVLGIQLGGDSRYGGILVRKPTLGDATCAIVPDDITRAVRLMRGTAVLAVILCFCIARMLS